MSRIVVGLDDSDGARRALRWAVDRAAAFGASVEVVHAYEFRPAWIDYDQGAEGMERWRERAADGATACIHRVVTETVGEMATVVEKVVVPGDAASVLMDAASGAELLVVGSRGRGRFAGAVLGSVGRRCIERAPCPVVVVPAGAMVAREDAAEAPDELREVSARGEGLSDRPTIVGLHHVRVPVSDVLESRDWYTDVLGFDPMLVSEEETSISGQALLHPSGLVVGLHVDPDAARALKGFCVLGLGVDDLADWVDYLDRNDISHGPVELGPRGKHVCINDPDGLVVELHTLA